MKARQRLAALVVAAINAASRFTGRGSGTVVGGKVGLVLDPSLLSGLSERRTTVLVSGTNGKTTTTALLAAGMSVAGLVATNQTGSNMPAGHVAALVAAPDAYLVALEVDEAYLDQTIAATNAQAVILLNLSRDQLDRLNEVRKLAERWRMALSDYEGLVIANADDPLVVYAARESSKTVFVEAGLVWNQDAVGCPHCGGQILFEATWHCSSCDLEQPPARWRREEHVVIHDGCTLGTLELSIPGFFNLDNALLALSACDALGIASSDVLKALTSVGTVAGRFEQRKISGTVAELMLAKNPAGWAALLELVASDSQPVVISINSRIADGADPSWLWDVDFSALSGRTVVATGERWRDLSVRLDYADIEHHREPNPAAAIALAGREGTMVSAMANYTAFGDLRGLS